MKTITVTDCKVVWSGNQVRISSTQENSNELMDIILSKKAVEILKHAMAKTATTTDAPTKTTHTTSETTMYPEAKKTDKYEDRYGKGGGKNA